MKNVFITFAIIVAGALCLHGQTVKNELVLPKVKGVEVLKCDFHIHTVYSDGMVWPTVRVDEAIREGLDAIALTEHIEHRPKLDEFTSKDHNRSYELAKKSAMANEVILIRGTEVTRRMAPGHFNAIFIQDGNGFEKYVNKKDTRDGANIAETLNEGRTQDGFVFWNHPWFQHPENRSEWADIHEELYRKKLISGIEVINGDRYDPVILDWCLEKNLTVIANSDIHAPMNLAQGEYRAMTLVFAKERSEAAIKQALVDRQTVAYGANAIYGKEELVRPLVENALTVTTATTGKKSRRVEFANMSGIGFDMQVCEENGVSPKLRSERRIFTIPAYSTLIVPVSIAHPDEQGKKGFTVEVLNAQIGGNKPLKCFFEIR